jgi:hypothetical protein
MRHLDSSYGRSDGQMCDWLSKFTWNSFLNRATFGWCCPSVRTVVLQLHTISLLRLEFLDHGVCRPYCWTSSARLALSKIVSERNGYVFRTVVAIFPYLCFGKKFIYLSNTKGRLAMLLRRPDGCNLDGKFSSSKRMMRWQLSVRTEYYIVRTDARDLISLTWNLYRIF